MEFNAVYRRENIVWNAIELINESGVHALSTKLIAKRLGISEGTLFKHFPRKNDLLLAVLDQFALYDEDMFYTTQNKMENPKEAILFYINSYIIYYESYPEIVSLIQVSDMFRGIPELEEKANHVFYKRYAFMKEMITKAQLSGQIRQDIGADILADIITSTKKGICTRWRFSKYSFSLREKVIEAVTMLLDAFKG